MPAKNLDNPEFWRFRAEEGWTIAEDMKTGEPKAIMLRIAEDYERIAKLVGNTFLLEATAARNDHHLLRAVLTL